jgi:tetratricopeptide (TPR) repeat protein
VPLPVARQAEATADCYALLLMLASVQAQQSPPGNEGQDKRRQALALLDRARQLGIETQAYHARRADLLEQLGETAEARQERERAASISLTGALDHFLLGEEQYRRRDLKQAINSFNRALGLEPGHFWAQFFLAVCHLHLQQWEPARASLNACLAQQRDFAWAWIFRSLANDGLLARAEAHEDLQTALQLNPNDDMRCVVFLMRGIVHFKEKLLDAAENDFQAALALRPNRYNAHLSLASVHLARGEFEQAEQQLNNALRLGPPDQVVYDYQVTRGRGLVRAGLNEEALEACVAALNILPNQPAAFGVRGRALLQIGRFAECEQAYEEYLKRGGDATPEFFRGRGQARFRLAKYPEAAEDFGRALEREPDAEGHLRRGWAYFFADAPRFALRDFAKAIELGSPASEAYTGRGLAQTALGNYRDAVADAELALERPPATPEMMHNLACIFAQSAAQALTDPGERDKQTLATAFRRRALELVRNSLQMLKPEKRSAFWRDKVFPDRALRSIHDEQGFKQLVEQYR